MFSCACGGDAATDPYCRLQKDTSFLVHVRAASNDGGDANSGTKTTTEDVKALPLTIHMREYGGVPNLNYSGDPRKYDYASAAVWDANFTRCTWKVTQCLDPVPSMETCVVYDCPAGATRCPPPDVAPCPGRNILGCGDVPDADYATRYWQHPCNPLVTPQDKGITFWCRLNGTSAANTTVDGAPSHSCYWTQPGVIPAFAVTCRVGNCVYDDDDDGGGDGDLCPIGDVTPPEYWTGDLLTRIGMTCVAASLVLAAAAYVRAESRSTYSRVPAEEAMREATAPRAPGTRRPTHVRTPSRVSESRRDGRRARTSEMAAAAGEVAVAADDADDAEWTIAPRVVSWENVRVGVRRGGGGGGGGGGGATKKILRNVSGFAGRADEEYVDAMATDARGGSHPSSPSRSPRRRVRDDDGGGGGGGGGGVFAILGPSGAGKSTLLDFLAGRGSRHHHTISRGVVRVDGRVVAPEEMRRVSGYVQQTDVLPGTSTVWEHLLFNAMLRLPGDVGKDETYRVVVGWMRELGLTKLAHAHIGDAFTRGLSGGEKRRVSVATELLTSPGVMFLDEPTTGLDATNAAKVVDILAGLGALGVTILLSIHQPRPDIFRLLDRVCVLSSHGGVVYCGPSDAAESHFASLPYVISPRETSVHIADYVLDVVLRSTDEDVRRMIDDFRISRIRARNDAYVRRLARRVEEEEEEEEGGGATAMRTPKSRRRRVAASRDAERALSRKHVAPFAKQTRLLCGRLLRNLGRHPFLLAIHLLGAFAVAVGVGSIFYDVGSDQGGIQNRMGSLFFILLYLTLMSLSSLPVWREDRLLFLRERSNGAYGVNAYFTSTLLFDVLPMRVLPPFFFGLITYQMIGLNEGDEDCLAWFVLTLIVTNVAATCMCMAIGAASRSVASANAIASLCFLVAALFGGFLLNKDQIPRYARWIAAVSFVNYGYEALVVNEFADNPRTFTLTSGWNSTTLPNEVPVPGEKVLSTFGFHVAEVSPDVAVVCAQAAFFACASYVMLRNAERETAPTWSGAWRACARFVGECWRRRYLVEKRSAARATTTTDEEESMLPSSEFTVAYDSDEYSSDDDDGEEEEDEIETLLDEAPMEPDATPSADETDEPAGDAPGDLHRRANSLLHDIDEEHAVSPHDGARNAAVAPMALRLLRDGGGSPGGGGGGGGGGREDDDDSRPRRRRVLTWEDITVNLAPSKGGRRILQSVSGIAGATTGGWNSLIASPSRGGGGMGERRADLFAILGPSGAGKTTLLDVLAGRPSPGHVITGDVALDGERMSNSELRHVSGYVPQDDVLPGTSTVWEHLMFHAALRLPGSVDRKRLRSVVWQTMRDLGITKLAHAHIGDAFTRGLSGGEKRRVSVATELLTSPGVMFLDEPTTGLDATNAAKVVDILAGLGALGVTILLSIHQPRPDIFRLLDRVLVMSSDGRVVYSGPSLDAEAHFESMRNVPRKPEAVNIADFMLDVVLSADDDDIDAMIDDFEKSDVRANGRNMTHTLRVRCEDGDGGGDDDDGGDDAAATPLTKYVASYPRQVRALLRRMVRNVRRHPFLILLHFVATGVASLGLGGVFFAAGKDTGGIQNRMGCLFFILLYLALMSLSSLPVWREDRLLFLRERASGAYGVNAYFTSVVLFDVLVLRVFPPMFFTVVTYPLVGLHGGSFLVYLARASWFTLVNVLANVASSALCMAIGIVTPSNAVANVCGLMAILSSVLSGGFLLNKQNVSGSSVSSSSSAAAAASHRSPANVFVKVLTKTSFVNYAYDALLVNEFLDAGTFRFTPKFTDAAGQNENAGVGVDVSGREVLQFFSFGDTRAAMRYDVCVLCAIAGAYLAAAFVLLKVSVRRSGAGRG